MDYCSQLQIPAFGHWEDYYEGLPITQYFESAWQAGLWDKEKDEDLFQVLPAAPAPIKPNKAVKKGGVGLEKVEKHKGRGGDEKEKGGGGGGGGRKVVVVACEVRNQRGARRSSRVPKALDEDLYKIPPELVCQRPKKKRLLSNLLSGCLGLNCIL